jgi:hypothetical protein
MYAIKPFGKAALIGSTIGSYTLGVGMRWRETDVEIVERRVDPFDEVDNLRRSILPQNTLRMLHDIGVTPGHLERHLLPARKWRFLTSLDLSPLREGEAYSGCAPLEPVFAIAEGHLVRLLRSQFLRFGGGIAWGSKAYDAFDTGDGSDTWTLRKEFGVSDKLEGIFSFAKSAAFFNELLVVDDHEKVKYAFDEFRGVCRKPSADIASLLFGTSDVDTAICVGDGVAVHLWRYHQRGLWPSAVERERDGAVAWRCVATGKPVSGANGDKVSPMEGELHPLLRAMISEHSSNQLKRVVVVPGTVPAIKDSARLFRAMLCGEALLPVDPFEWRGDRARVAVEEASAMVRALYGKKYYRGHMPTLMREMEQDSAAKRTNLLRRDLLDAEAYMAKAPRLPDGIDDPAPRQVAS